jgi:hypothetical protein
VYNRGNSEVPEERVCKRKKNDEIQMWERGKGCRMCYEERETIEHMWNGCSEMREREGKERGEILIEDGREIRWMKEIWKRRERDRGVG